MLPLGENTNDKLTVLDDKFWVWETLDEAIRPVIKELPEDELMTVLRAFSANYKGSQDLWDFMTMRVHHYGSSFF